MSLMNNREEYESEHENVILLNMSTRNGNNCVHYYYKKNENEEYRFDGISQLEAGTKCIMALLAEKNESVNRIVIMTTKESEGEATRFYIKRIMDYCNGKENNSIDESKSDKIIDHKWKEEIGSKIDEVLGGKTVEYKELTTVCNNIIKECKEEYSNILSKNLCGICNMDEFQKSVAEAVGEVLSEETDKVENELLCEYGKIAERIPPKGLADSGMSFQLTDKWLYYVYNHLKCKYEILRMEHQSETEVERLIKIIEKLSLYLDYLQNKKEKIIETFIKEYVYQKYCNGDTAVSGRKRAEIKFEILKIESSQSNAIFLPESIENNKDVAFYNIISKIKGDGKSKIHLYIDTQGGFRSFMTEAMAISELLVSQNVELKGRYAVEFKFDNIVNEICEVSDNYKTYELITAMKTFKEYGRGEGLEHYFEKYYKDNDTATKLTKLISVC